MLDVHPPHEPVHGLRDFLLHILTITIGLLIALGLEGLVTRYEHHHLVHEATESLHREIQSNAQALPEAMGDLQKRQAAIEHDLVVVNAVLSHRPLPADRRTSVTFNINAYDDVSWRTAQVSGAITYMPYAEAQQYADIYDTQEALNQEERESARDAIQAIALLSQESNGANDPFAGRAGEARDKLQLLEGDLLLAKSIYKHLDRMYQQYLDGHGAE